MGKLADALNVPHRIEVDGEYYNVARLPIKDVYKAVSDGLIFIDNSLRGDELTDKVQKCIDSGSMPVAAIENLVYESMKDVNEGFDRKDAAALCIFENLEKAEEITIIAMALPKVEDPKPEAGEQQSH